MWPRENLVSAGHMAFECEDDWLVEGQNPGSWFSSGNGDLGSPMVLMCGHRCQDWEWQQVGVYSIGSVG
jgi:hypothetical protein